jgi:hypothetical protein
LPPVIDIHIHITPMEGFKPEAQELVRRGRKDFEDAIRFAASPSEFLKFMDGAEVERAGLINYVSPDVIGCTSEVNEWVAALLCCQSEASAGVRFRPSQICVRSRR